MDVGYQKSASWVKKSSARTRRLRRKVIEAGAHAGSAGGEPDVVSYLRGAVQVTIIPKRLQHPQLQPQQVFYTVGYTRQ